MEVIVTCTVSGSETIGVMSSLVGSVCVCVCMCVCVCVWVCVCV